MVAARLRPRAPQLVDEEGFTTISMVIAIVLTLALLFSAAQIYRLESESAAIQEVADASALAAENIVAEYMIVVKVCDAVVLSLSLLTLTVFGISVVLLCIPGAQGIAEALISAGSKIVKARDTFAEKASSGLTQFQRALPYLSAASAASVALANSESSPSTYVACCVLVPAEGDEIAMPEDEAGRAVEESVEASKDDLAEAARRSEEAAARANEAKERAFQADCGAYPAACMRERAASLAGLEGPANPGFTSVDTWSFSVALERARAYYRARAVQNTGTGSVEEQSNAAMRSIFYRYAIEELDGAYVHESGDSFDAFFPLLPKNTDEMRQTRLYTETRFPKTVDGAGRGVLHAWAGCPAAASAAEEATLAEAEAAGFASCDICHFKASDLGKVGAASSSIANGFEYHYRIVAEAAEAYREARSVVDAESTEAKAQASSLFDKIGEAMGALGGHRIDVTPPGAKGAVALVADLSIRRIDTGLSSSWVRTDATVGPKAAVSAATLIAEPAGEAGSVIDSLLDGFGRDPGAVVGAGRIILSAWTGLLDVYTNGVDAVSGALDKALSSTFLSSLSGLGTWSAGTLADRLKDIGLEPVNLDALKPVLVNSGQVTSSDTGRFSTRFMQIKDAALSLTNPEGGIFADLIDEVQTNLDGWIDDRGEIEIACIEVPFVDLSFPIVITLPPSLTETGHDVVKNAADGLRNLIGSAIRGSRWQ